MQRGRKAAGPLVVLALLLAACGGDDGDDDTEAGGDGGVAPEDICGEAGEAGAEEEAGAGEESGEGEESGGESGQEEDFGDASDLDGTVTLFHPMEAEEAEALDAAFEEHIAPEVGYSIDLETSGEFETDAQIRVDGGNPSDIHMYPQPGTVLELAEAGEIVSLEDLGFDIEELEATYGEYLLSLGEFDGEHYGLPTNVNLKSMVWYPKDDFDAAGYEVPETCQELVELSNQIVEDGSTPWCVGFESEGSSGWPATDWMEDIMLRTAGTEVYDQWVSHEIPFDDPAVVNAAEIFGRFMFTEGWVLGGAQETPAIAFGDAPAPMFEDPPNCFLHRQASFINGFFPEGVEAGVDYDWFPLPPMEQEGILFGGELSVVFRDAPEVVDFLQRFAGVEMQCAQGAAVATSRISPNINVESDCYANESLARASEILTTSFEEGTGRFDASDLMPSAVGSDAFWTAMLDYMDAGPDAAPDVLADVEAAWP